MENIFDDCNVIIEDMGEMNVCLYDDMLRNIDLIGKRRDNNKDYLTACMIIKSIEEKLTQKSKRLYWDWKKEESNIIHAKNLKMRKLNEKRMKKINDIANK